MQTRSGLTLRPKRSSKPAGFLDLPPELRNRIYELVMPTSHVSITQLRLPPLAHVNRQIREDCLDIACARITLTVHAHATFFMPGVADGPWPRQSRQRVTFALERFEETFGDRLHFRHVVWRIHDRWMKYRRQLSKAKTKPKPLLPRDFEVFAMELKLSEDEEEKEVLFSEPKVVGREEEMGVPSLGGVEEISNAMMVRSSVIAAAHDFKGFTPRDLAAIMDGL